MLKIAYKPSTSHWIFPPIIMGILVVFLILMGIQRYAKCRKSGKPFINTKFRFFDEGADKVKLFGTLFVFILYILIMEKIGFLASSILCIFLFNILYEGFGLIKQVPIAIKEKTFFRNEGFKSVISSLIISIAASMIIWFLFAVVFDVTLP